MKLYTKTLEPNGAVMTCYLQEPNPELPDCTKRPGVLVLPGGGYSRCCRREGEPVALAYTQAGYQAFVLEYSTGNRQDPQSMKEVFRKAFADGCAAMQYLREQAESFWLDSSQIATVGFSAGGNLAAALGTMATPAQRPDAMILGYASIQPPYREKLGFEQPDLIEQVDKNTPPTFLFNTQADTVVPAENTLLFALALARAGVPFESHTFLIGDHGLSLATACTTDDGTCNPDVAQWHPMSLRFLQNLWNPPTQTARPRLSVDAKLSLLLADDRVRKLLQQFLPDHYEKISTNPMAHNVTLRVMANYAAGQISPELLAEIDRELKILN